MYELMEEEAERGDSSAKEESATRAFSKLEGRTTGEQLQDATGDNAACYDLTETAKMESTPEEVNELAEESYEMAKNDMCNIESTDPKATPWDAAREGVIADVPGGAIIDELRRQPTAREFATKRTYGTTGEETAGPLRDTSAQEDTSGNKIRGYCLEETPI